eukprot:TRINITY_DN2583_c0_g1_i1.p1 TRINITY_DN2583_c0_g1~~TRINITY_DN2583_c0_g1_i1.p1  ORF type:complete len:116 (-),score=30.88 TRINITY_DN2583_c0_g1_i1:130-477(-)
MCIRDRAYKALGEMSVEEAKREYVSTISRLLPDWREQATDAYVEMGDNSDSWEETQRPLMSTKPTTHPSADDSLDFILLPMAGAVTLIAVYYWYQARSLRSTVRKLKRLSVMSKL